MKTTEVAKRDPRPARPAQPYRRALRAKIKTILVPLDFSRSSMDALEYAMLLARQFHAVIHLVHVVHPDEAAETPGAGHLMQEVANALMRAHEEPQQCQSSNDPWFWPENCHILSGRPDQEICALGCDLDADLIVVATRGRTAWKRILLGSVATNVARHARRPVLLVPARPYN